MNAPNEVPYEKEEYANRVIRVYKDGRIEVWTKYNGALLARVRTMKEAKKVADAMLESDK